MKIKFKLPTLTTLKISCSRIALGAHTNSLIEMVILSVIDICFGGQMRKLTFDEALLSGGLV